MIDTGQIADNLAAVNRRIHQAALRSGREPSEISLVVVSKTFPAEAIEAAVAAGASDIGESRVQEGVEKVERLGDICRWHLIGHLQSNKAGKAVRAFDMIHSLDTVGLAAKVSQQAVRLNKLVDCLIEFNSSGEENKYGFASADILPAAREINDLPGINLCGLMTIGPWTTDVNRIRNAFETTRLIFDEIRAKMGGNFDTLSMGMSADYELAIECGSTMVRVGTAIFGERQKKK